MIKTGPKLKQFCDAMTDATKELSTVTLGLDGIELTEWQTCQPCEGKGSCLSLVNDDLAVQIGVISDCAGCESLTRMMLGMEENEELTNEDISDAIGEIANILAGGIKSTLSESGSDFKIGLPIVINGQIILTDQQRCMCAQSILGAVNAKLMLIMENNSMEE